MPKISVIMPVYNVKKYLVKSIDSVINQTFKDFELVCVNDGSTDKSLEMLEEYAKKDSRIKIISQKNKGLPGARNVGMENATGEYIYFFDSDDWITNDLLEKAYNKIIQDNSDIVIFDVFNVYDEKSIVPVRRCGYFKKKYHIDKLRFKDNREIIYHTPTAWSKLYKKSFLIKNNLKFPEHFKKGEEDTPFWVPLCLSDPLISILDECLYYYRKREDSLVGKASVMHQEKQKDVYFYIKEHSAYINSGEIDKLYALDFLCRLTIYCYSMINNFSDFQNFENSVKMYKQWYKEFKNYNLWQFKGYGLYKTRWIYTIGKKLVLNYLKKKYSNS